MAVIWETVDRLGRTVQLTEAGLAHILDGHEDMVDYQREIRIAVEHAGEITIDGQYRRRCVHYLRPVGTRPPIRVVVNYGPVPPGILIGQVINAYRSERKKEGEKTIWP